MLHRQKRVAIPLRVAAIFVLAALMLGGCTRKNESQESEGASGSAPTVLLQSGKGALLVVYPKPHRFDRQDWMAQVTLRGEHDAARLPRFPLADIQSLAVLNVLPGRYNVVTESWMRRYPPSSGGSVKDLIINAGEIVVLKAGPLGTQRRPYDGAPLDVVERTRWSLTDRNKLSDYLQSLKSDVTWG